MNKNQTLGQLRALLTAVGTAISGYFRSLDTGLYLDNSGAWVAGRVPFATATDATITAAGYAIVQRYILDAGGRDLFLRNPEFITL